MHLVFCGVQFLLTIAISWIRLVLNVRPFVRQVRNIGSVSGHRLLQPLSVARVVFLGRTARCGSSWTAEVLLNPRRTSASSRPKGYMDVPRVACFNHRGSPSCVRQARVCWSPDSLCGQSDCNRGPTSRAPSDS
jgi:hypothetical protein